MKRFIYTSVCILSSLLYVSNVHSQIDHAQRLKNIYPNGIPKKIILGKSISYKYKNNYDGELPLYTGVDSIIKEHEFKIHTVKSGKDKMLVDAIVLPDSSVTRIKYPEIWTDSFIGYKYPLDNYEPLTHIKEKVDTFYYELTDFDLVRTNDDTFIIDTLCFIPDNRIYILNTGKSWSDKSTWIVNKNGYIFSRDWIEMKNENFLFSDDAGEYGHYTPLLYENIKPLSYSKDGHYDGGYKDFMQPLTFKQSVDIIEGGPDYWQFNSINEISTYDDTDLKSFLKSFLTLFSKDFEDQYFPIENKGYILRDIDVGNDISEAMILDLNGHLGKQPKYLPLLEVYQEVPDPGFCRFTTHKWTLDEHGRPIKDQIRQYGVEYDAGPHEDGVKFILFFIEDIRSITYEY